MAFGPSISAASIRARAQGSRLPRGMNYGAIKRARLSRRVLCSPSIRRHKQLHSRQKPWQKRARRDPGGVVERVGWGAAELGTPRAPMIEGLHPCPSRRSPKGRQPPDQRLVLLTPMHPMLPAPKFHLPGQEPKPAPKTGGFGAGPELAEPARGGGAVGTGSPADTHCPARPFGLQKSIVWERKRGNPPCGGCGGGEWGCARGARSPRSGTELCRCLPECGPKHLP